MSAQEIDEYLYDLLATWRYVGHVEVITANPVLNRWEVLDEHSSPVKKIRTNERVWP